MSSSRGGSNGEDGVERGIGKDCAGQNSRQEADRVPRPGTVLKIVEGAVRCICCGASWGNCKCGDLPRCHRLGCMGCVEHCVHGRLERMGKMAVELAIERHDLLEENEMLRQELTVRGIKLPAVRGR